MKCYVQLGDEKSCETFDYSYYRLHDYDSPRLESYLKNVGFTGFINHKTSNVKIVGFYIFIFVLVVQWLGVGLVIERSLVRLLAGALSSQLGQLSLLG